MTAELHLIRAPIELRAFHRWAGERGLMSDRTFDEGYALHKLLGECFGPGRLQPFRLLVPPRSSLASLYAYSPATAKELAEEAQAVALPEHLNVVSPAALEGKPMPEEWAPGRRLGFDLRTRPVRRIDREGDRSGVVELDAFLHEARGLPEGEMARRGRTREAVYRDWLAGQLERLGGARLERCRLTAFRRTRPVRADGRRGPEGPDATLQGEIVTTDGAAFAKLLARGIGRHRAYGYGMLMLRPAGTRPPNR